MSRLMVSLCSDGVDPARASLNYLTRRFADPNRLNDLPPYAELTAPKYPPHKTPALLEVDVVENGAALSLSPGRLHRFPPDGSPSFGPVIHHAAVMGDEIAILLDDSIRIVDRLGGATKRAFSYTFFNGGHTIYAAGDGKLLVSGSSHDCFFVIDGESGAVERLWTVPEAVYGTNYPITEAHDNRRHYIPNDLQLAHLNSAFMRRDGDVLVTTLIQGDIGLVDPDGGYRLLARGFVGAHNARETASGDAYFADSCAGMLVILNEDGSLARRYDFGSCWLHDVIEVGAGVFLGSVADRRKLVLADIERDAILGEIDVGAAFDMTPKFVSAPYEAG